MKQCTFLLSGIQFIGILYVLSGATEYVATDMVKGYSWNYQKDSVDVGSKESIHTFIDITIDSVWGIGNDTAFYLVTEVDSVANPASKSLVKILCKKTNGIASCSSALISSMFTNYELTQYDSGAVGAFQTKYHGDSLLIVSGNRTLNAVRKSTHYQAFGINPEFFDDTMMVADKIGLLYYVTTKTRTYYGSGGTTIKLVKYCHNDFSYATVTTKLIVHKERGAPSHQPSWKKVVFRNNSVEGYNVLGKQGRFQGNGLKILLIKR
jgi:hypothetical protein